MQRQDGELDLPWPSAQPAAQSCCRSRLPPATCPAPPAVPASATEPLTPADLIPGYLGTGQLYPRVFVLTRRCLAGDRQCLFV